MVKEWLNIALWNGLCKPWLSLIQLRISRVILAGATSKIKLLVFDKKNIRNTVAEEKLVVGQRTKMFHSHMTSNPGTEQMVPSSLYLTIIRTRPCTLLTPLFLSAFLFTDSYMDQRKIKEDAGTITGRAMELLPARLCSF